MRNDVNINLDVNQQANNENESQRCHLRMRANDIYYQKEEDLRPIYYMNENPPKNAEDLIQRIKDGAFTLPAKEKRNPYNFFGIEWRTQPKDTDGFDKAWDALTKELRFLNDTIAIAPPAEALAALREWEAKPVAPATATIQ